MKQFFANFARLAPARRATENSPPIYRWVNVWLRRKSRQGRKNAGVIHRYPTLSSVHRGIGNTTSRHESAYMMMEALVYVGVLFVLLGVGYQAVYRCIDRSEALRHNADDIGASLHAGERWRADVRATAAHVKFETNGARSALYLATSRGEITYRFETNSILRRAGSNQWVCLLPNVKWSAMESDQRKTVTAVRWDFELLPYKKETSNTNHVHPLFTFLAVPQKASP